MSTASLFVDAGGSVSRVRMLSAQGTVHQHQFGPINPASGLVWHENLNRVVNLVRSVAGSDHVTGLIGSASISPGTVDREERVWRQALTGLSGSVDVLLMNDAIPLVSQRDITSHQIGIVLGTGSCFVAQKDAQFRRWGGMEWLVSDEGGATHLGLVAIKHLAEALDGRRPWSDFFDELIVAGGAQTGHALLRKVAEQPHPKPALASLAPYVLSGAFEMKDPNAANVVDLALHDIGRYLECVAAYVGAPATCTLTGGLMNSRNYRAAVESLVVKLIPGVSTSVVNDALSLAQGVDRDLARGAIGYVASIRIPED